MAPRRGARRGGLLYEQVVAGIERQDWALLRRNDQLDLQLAQPYWDARAPPVGGAGGHRPRGCGAFVFFFCSGLMPCYGTLFFNDRIHIGVDRDICEVYSDT